MVEFIKKGIKLKVTCLDANLPYIVELSFFAVSLNLFYLSGEITVLEIGQYALTAS